MGDPRFVLAYEGPEPRPGDLVCLNSLFLVSVVEAGPRWVTGTLVWERFPEDDGWTWWERVTLTNKDFILVDHLAGNPGVW